MNDITQAPVVQLYSVTGPMAASGAPFVQFRVGGKDPASKVSVNLVVPPAPTLADLIAACGEEKVTPLINTLLSETFTEAVRSMYAASKKQDDALKTASFAALPESFDAIASLMAELTPVQRAARASGKRDMYALSADDAKLVLEAYVKAASARALARTGKAPNATAVKAQVMQTFGPILTAKSFGKPLQAVFTQVSGTALFGELIGSATPPQFAEAVMNRISALAATLEESAELAWD